MINCDLITLSVSFIVTDPFPRGHFATQSMVLGWWPSIWNETQEETNLQEEI